MLRKKIRRINSSYLKIKLHENFIPAYFLLNNLKLILYRHLAPTIKRLNKLPIFRF